MTFENEHIYLNRLESEEHFDKMCLEILLNTSKMDLSEKISFNLKPETWKNRLSYYALFVKEYLGR